jgi:hypothetical protein
MGRFKPGHAPWNKGLKGWTPGGNSEKTRYKPGNRSGISQLLWAPIGSERITKGGYRQRKITDTGYSPRDWKGIHILLWEETFGPLPSGFIVVFRNRDIADIRIENLECISRQENMRRNSIHNLPEEIRKTIAQRNWLLRTIKRLDKCHEEQD